MREGILNVSENRLESGARRDEEPDIPEVPRNCLDVPDRTGLYLLRCYCPTGFNGVVQRANARESWRCSAEDVFEFPINDSGDSRFCPKLPPVSRPDVPGRPSSMHLYNV